MSTKGQGHSLILVQVTRFNISNFFSSITVKGERGGSVVECQTPEREVGGFETYRRRVVSLSKTLYSPKVLVNYPGSDDSVPT